MKTIPSNPFSLSDIDKYADELQEKHPKNQNIETPIRQQLQALRDQGLIEFLGDGSYKKVE